MRTVTIIRAENNVAPKSVCKVYVTDPNAPDAAIGSEACREVGTLNNGGSTVFAVGSEPVRILVAAEDAEQADRYDLPEGDADVTLTGECVFLRTGNTAFLFDSSIAAQIEAQKAVPQKKKPFVLVILLVLVTVLAAAGARFAVKMYMQKKNADTGAHDRTFKVQNLSITLSDEFIETSEDDLDASFESDYCGVYLQRDSFTMFPELSDWTPEDYANAIKPDGGEIKTQDGIPYIEYRYTSEESGETYYSVIVPVKGPDAYWSVFFVTFIENAVRLRPTIFRWAKSITFDN